MKSKCNKQTGCTTNFTKTNLSDKKASHEVFLILAKNGKAFRDGEVRNEDVLAFGDTTMAKEFEPVLLSNQTVAKRVMELNDHVPSKEKVIVQQCKYFSLALDESVDVRDVNQLLIFIRTITKNFTIHEELLQAIPL